MTIQPTDQVTFNDLDPADKSLVRRLLRRPTSRRETLELMLATGLGLASAQHLLSAAGTLIAETPQKGGSVRVALSLHVPDDKLDPVLFTSGIDYSRGRATYNNLCQLDDNLVPQPELAESFTPNKDASEWTFKLRQGVEFHDGSKLTADDVIYSMNRHLGEDSVSVAKDVLASIKEWKKVGPYEVKAIMQTPNSDLGTLMGLYQTKIVKQGSKGDGIGTGPYKLEVFEPGIRSVHVRNENYWREGAHLDSCEITAITDLNARVNAVITDDIQLASDIDPKSIRQLEAVDSVRVNSVPAGTFLGIACLQNTAPGNNADLVKGLQYAQDRTRIVDKILKGHGSIGNDQPIMRAYGADWCSELEQRAFDLDKAQFHFEKSGLTTAELHVAPVVAGIEDVCLLAQANCAKIGFDLKLKRVPADGYWGAVWRKEPLNVTTWSMRPTANIMLTLEFAPSAAWNDTYWDNPRMGELLQLSRAETDPTKRHAMYCEMQQLVNTESGIIIPAHINIIDALNERVHGMPTNPLGNLGGYEWPEFIWLEA